MTDSRKRLRPGGTWDAMAVTRCVRRPESLPSRDHFRNNDRVNVNSNVRQVELATGILRRSRQSSETSCRKNSGQPNNTRMQFAISAESGQKGISGRTGTRPGNSSDLPIPANGRSRLSCGIGPVAATFHAPSGRFAGRNAPTLQHSLLIATIDAKLCQLCDRTG